MASPRWQFERVDALVNSMKVLACDGFVKAAQGQRKRQSSGSVSAPSVGISQRRMPAGRYRQADQATTNRSAPLSAPPPAEAIDNSALPDSKFDSSTKPDVSRYPVSSSTNTSMTSPRPCYPRPTRTSARWPKHLRRHSRWRIWQRFRQVSGASFRDRRQRLLRTHKHSSVRRAP